ncbi:DsbA family protein [[Kitasatospora] papulosa]|uniref:DsbA family protein n=1 Tax=[Kitasatospora] papulosa TaxID=1464011 RepID=UPI003692BA19
MRNPKTSARAAWAAGQQDRFWQLHEQAYLTEGTKNIGAFATYKLIDMGRAAGVKDLGRFREDMASEEASAVVGKDREEGHPLGVTSTPAFLINDVPVLGGQPVDTFKQTIETAAEQAR